MNTVSMSTVEEVLDYSWKAQGVFLEFYAATMIDLPLKNQRTTDAHKRLSKKIPHYNYAGIFIDDELVLAEYTSRDLMKSVVKLAQGVLDIRDLSEDSRKRMNRLKDNAQHLYNHPDIVIGDSVDITD